MQTGFWPEPRKKDWWVQLPALEHIWGQDSNQIWSLNLVGTVDCLGSIQGTLTEQGLAGRQAGTKLFGKG
jgi:hypothetical protein